MEILAWLEKERGDIMLRPRPGKRKRSNVCELDMANGETLGNMNGMEIGSDEARTLEKLGVVVEDSDDDLEIE